MFGRQHVRVVRKSRGADPAVQPDPSASLGRCVPPSSGCFLSLQPSTNLALVCRFLSSRDLLSAYKVSRALSAAAASPLTFQHEREWTIDHADKGIDTIGPAAVCTGQRRLKTAMDSRLFRSFRILKIRAECEEELRVMLQMLQSPDAPTLHVLQLECLSPISMMDLSDVLQFPFLRVLSLRSSSFVSFNNSTYAGLPRLRVFQLAHTVDTDDPFIPADLMALLKPLTELRTCIFRSTLPYTLTNECSEATMLSDVYALARLESEVPQLEAIHWMLCWSQERMRAEVDDLLETRDEADPPAQFPVLTKVRSAMVNEVRLDPSLQPQPDWSEEQLSKPFNSLMPQLTELRAFVRDDPRFHDYSGKALQIQLAKAALPLTSLTLLEQAAVRMWGECSVYFSPALFPSLTVLSCNFPLTGLDHFAHMPQLHTLKELKYSHDPERAKVDDPARCFPALTDLHLSEGLTVRSLYTLIAQIPHLKSVAMKLNPPQDPRSFIAAGLALIDAREAERLALEARLAAPELPDDDPNPAELLQFDENFSALIAAASSGQHAPMSSSFEGGTFQMGATATSSPAKPGTATSGESTAAAPPSFAFSCAPAATTSPFSFAAPAASASSFGSSSDVSSSSAFTFAPSAAAPSFAFNLPTAAGFTAPLSAPAVNPFVVPASSATSSQGAGAAPFRGSFNFGSFAAALPTAESSSRPPAPQ